MAKYTHTYGGVGAPVGLTVFKTAGGSLGAVPGGFDSHTPLPLREARCLCAVRYNFRITKNSAVTLENILKKFENIQINFRKNCTIHSVVTERLNQLCAVPRCCHF